MLSILISLLIALSSFFIINYLLKSTQSLKDEGIVDNALEKTKSKSFLMPIILKRADSLGKLFKKIKYKKFLNLMDSYEKDFQCLGGKYSKYNPYQYFVLQIFSMIGGIIFCILIISMDLIIILFFAALFFALPFIKLKEDVKKRKELILKQLPDMADLLSVMLESGSDFFGAAEKVSNILKGPLADDFKSALAKISLGYDKKEALNEIIYKSGLEQVGFFIRTVTMALDAGVGMAGTLKRLALQIRNERASAAEKKAQEAPIKILIPLVLFIFPTIFIVIFGPIVINFIQTGGL